MNRTASLYAIPLLLSGAMAMAADDRSADHRSTDPRSTDLRYCLDLPTNQQIAQCAGEISADKKGKPFSKAEVERILSMDKAATPSAIGSSGVPATAATPAGDKPENAPQPEPAQNNTD